MEFLYGMQRWIHGSLSADLSAFAASRNWMQLALMLPLGIAFGALHALTPGHGKTVLASYLVGSRLAVLRGAAVALTLASTHVLSAVLLALAAAPLVTRTIGGAGRAPLLEQLSAALLAGIGLWLLFRALRARPHSHGEGMMVAMTAGLVPCPLTLFAMFLALSRGVPEAGLTFALAMLLGIGATLSGVALLTILARDAFMSVMERHGKSVARLARLLDGLSGGLLVIIGVRALLAAPRL